MKARKIDFRLYFSLFVIVTLVCTGVFAEFLSPFERGHSDLTQRLQGPSVIHLLGTDGNGADVLSSLILGAQTSLFIAFTAVFFSTSIGIVLGAISGYFGGRTDLIIMRVADIFMAFPGILLALAVAAMLGPGWFNIVIAISVSGWTAPARLVRQEVLALKEREFVLAAYSLGASHIRLILKHILPLSLSPLMIQATFALSAVIITESSLSFLGLGSGEVSASWGSLLSEGRKYLEEAPLISIAPGFAIMIVVIAFNFLGDALQERLEVKSL